MSVHSQIVRSVGLLGKKVIKSLQEHVIKVRETEYSRAIADLKAEKKQAYEEGDADRLIEIDEQLAEIKANERIQAQQAQEQAKKPDPRFVEWVSQNKWYGEDRELRAFADQVGLSYKASNPDLTPSEVLEYVSKRVLRAYPEKFKNERRNRASIVEGSGTPTNTHKAKAFDMTEEERRVMNTFVRSKVMTEAEYIRDLKAIKGIKE